MPLPNRRALLRGGAATLVALWAGGCAASGAGAPTLPSFAAVPPGRGDTLVVPAGYRAEVLLRWGDALGLPGAAPSWQPDGSHSADDQARLAGMHHDGMHFFALDGDGRRGLLVMNHEYTDERLLLGAAPEASGGERTRKSQHAVGVSVVEVALGANGWQVVRPSPFARRIHANTPMRLSGPAAGSALTSTAQAADGRTVLGTLANCAMGVTPWGTYLSCEENFHGYFGGPGGAGQGLPASLRRYGIGPGRQWVDWWEHDARFDVTRHPNEAHRFGWVVEIDPMDPDSTPVKRTALGRKSQESATCTLTRDGRVAVYMGDDARFEYIYKFVSRDPVRAGGYRANRDLLDHGTLYVARFDADGRGHWLPLVHGRSGLDAGRGFASQADVVVNARGAADHVGATPMDRPEWIAVHPGTGEVFATLSNNTQRGAPGKPGPDAANPRVNNAFGHILRWRESGDDAAAQSFTWSVFALAGDPTQQAVGARYPSPAADAFGAPDGLHFDSAGLLWIQTDLSGTQMHKGSAAPLGNNQMLCANVATGEIRRFMTGPRGSEITGCVLTPDRRTMFVNIQHPGETRDDGGAQGHWPDGGDAPPRSATVMVRRDDGGVIGS